MKRNFNELFSKMKPESQDRVKARSKELLQEMAIATAPEDAPIPSTDANAMPSDEVSPAQASANRKVALHGAK